MNIIKEEKLLEDLLISDCFVNQKTKEVMLYAYENIAVIEEGKEIKIVDLKTRQEEAFY